MRRFRNFFAIRGGSRHEVKFDGATINRLELAYCGSILATAALGAADITSLYITGPSGGATLTVRAILSNVP